MLSGKRIKKYTKDEFGFELSSNAFAALKDRIDNRISDYESGQLDDWIMRVLKEASSLNKFVVRKRDIELIFDQIIINNKDHEDDKCDDVDDKVSDNDDGPSYNEIIDNDDKLKPWKDVEIIQIPSRWDDDRVKEEIERLKKIIQIILNKQAELT